MQVPAAPFTRDFPENKEIAHVEASWEEWIFFFLRLQTKDREEEPGKLPKVSVLFSQLYQRRKLLARQSRLDPGSADPQGPHKPWSSGIESVLIF